VEDLTTSKGNSKKLAKNDPHNEITINDIKLSGSMFGTVPEDISFYLD